MRYIKLFITVFLLLPALSINAQQYNFIHLDNNQGLSHNQINRILKDSKGFVWIGTQNGLNRYDGYKFKVFKNDPDDLSSIIGNTINEISEDPKGRIWVGTNDGLSIYDPSKEIFYRNIDEILKEYNLTTSGIQKITQDNNGSYWFISKDKGAFRYDPIQRKTTHFQDRKSDSRSIGSNSVSSVVSVKSGFNWMIHRNGVLEKIDSRTNKVVYRNDYFKDLFKRDSSNYNMISDKDEDLWIFSMNDRNGIFYYDVAKKSFTHIYKNSSPVNLNTDIVSAITEDNRGRIWIGTDHGGINLLDKKTTTMTYLLTDVNNEKALSQNSINSIYKDNSGIIWIGTFKKGIDYYHENLHNFQLYKYHSSNPRGLPYEDVNRFVEDDKGNLWIGTNGGGLIYFDKANNKFTQFSSKSNPEKGLKSDVIVSLCIDHENILWVGTYYGGLYKFDGNKFIQYKNDLSVPASLSDNNVWEIFEDSQKNLWVGTLTGGLNLFDRNRNSFTHFKKGDVNSVHSNYISSIIEDRQGNLWIGTSDGLDVLNKKTGRFVNYIHETNNPKSLSDKNIYSIVEDKRGMIWVATNDGLNLLNSQREVVKVFRKKDGLPDNTILTLIEDNNGNLWLSTSNGIANLIVSEKRNGGYDYNIKLYNEQDGLQGKVFNENAAYKTKGGELIFGGANGFNVFKPEEIKQNNVIPPILFTELQVFNQIVKAGEPVNGRVILAKSISDIEELKLKHNENVFSIEFVALNYFHPEKNIYKYKLEGFDENWRTTDETSRKVTYTNLDPGTYTLKVKASNNDGFWNEEGKSLTISIMPPFWKTKIAYGLYAIIIAVSLILARKVVIMRTHIKFKIEQERAEAQRVHELDMLKIKFFTNISHEFRTPISLIITPLEKILKNTKDPEQRSQLEMVHRNGKRLLNLVNQLLDFRKMEVQEIKLNLSEGDIVQYVKDISNSFSDISEKKNIKLSYHSSISELNTLFDQDKLEKILFNLLSNAFKFTPQGGKVIVELFLKDKEGTSQEGKKWLEIRVKDSGIGINRDKHEKIFERFFQNDLPGNLVNQGSGIGLSITKEFVKIHGGTIIVESEPEHGACFILNLPITEISSVKEERGVEEVISNPSDSFKGKNLGLHKDPQKQNLLLVEDNEDFRFYLKDNLRTYYNILEASNGKFGWELAISEVPDVIVSDVMMPEMNGIEFCKKVREDIRTSHIPFILLTARTAEEQKLEGYETGASDYITKPFNFEILVSRIRNLIVQQELIRKSFQKHIVINASEVNITSMDEKMIKKAVEIVEANISNTDFSVEELSREIGMSRVHLYKKLLSLTGKSPIEFIRIIRVKRAAQLLLKSQLTVSEIAYQVGFNNPKYFAKYFKMEFKVLPSLYAEKFKDNS